MGLIWTDRRAGWRLLSGPHDHPPQTSPFLSVSFFTFIFLDRHSILRFAAAHYYWHFIQ
jgi:hypothetical protein